MDSSDQDLTGPSTTYADDGVMTVALRVRDEDGGVSAIQSAVVTVSNVPPTANAGTSYTGDEGSAITFSDSATDPGTNDTLTFEWDFNFQAGEFNADQSGDGLTTPEHTYPDDGEFTMALRVRDGADVSDIATTSVVVSNVLPTAETGGPYSGKAGTAITFSGLATDLGNDTLTYEWDFEYDGTFSTTGATNETINGIEVLVPAKTAQGVDLISPDYTYTDNGTFTVALRILDDDGVSVIATAEVTVAPLTEPTPTSMPTGGGGFVGGGGDGGGSGGGGRRGH